MGELRMTDRCAEGILSSIKSLSSFRYKVAQYGRLPRYLLQYQKDTLKSFELEAKYGVDYQAPNLRDFKVLNHVSLSHDQLISRGHAIGNERQMINLAEYFPRSLVTLRLIGKIEYTNTPGYILNALTKMADRKGWKSPYLRAICRVGMSSPWSDPKPWDMFPEELDELKQTCRGNGVLLNYEVEMPPDKPVQKYVYQPRDHSVRSCPVCGDKPPVLGEEKDYTYKLIYKIVSYHSNPRLRVIWNTILCGN
jgi:hypothetical protein